MSISQTELYDLIIGQLLFDGHHQAAEAVQAIAHSSNAQKSSRLSRLIALGASIHEGEEMMDMAIAETDDLAGIDFEDAAKQVKPPTYQQVGSFTPSGICRTAAFNREGTLAAVGGRDGALTILSVNEVLGAYARNADEGEVSALLRTYQDHASAVTDIAFHPVDAYVASASEDKTVRFFDLSSHVVARAFRTIQEAYMVRAISFHPSGEFIAVATDHPVIRIYDVTTLACYTPSNMLEHHTAPLTALRYSPNGTHLASGCKAGVVKVWDAVSNRCVTTFEDAHDGHAIASVQFSRNGKYLLTGAVDSSLYLWDLRAGRILCSYAGARQHMPCAVMSCFSHDEEYVLSSTFEKEGIKGAVHAWNTRSQAIAATVPGHNSTVRGLAHSPKAPVFLSCCDDKQIRIFQDKEQ